MKTKLLIVIFIGILAAFVLACGSAEKKPLSRLSQTVDLQGHRGARGLAPENTWPSFLEAYRYKMTTLELDTVVTKDNKLILHHDLHLNDEICRYEDERVVEETLISELTVEQLKALDCGSLKHSDFDNQKPVPGTRLITLDEFFEKVIAYEKENNVEPVDFNIETKIDSATATTDAIKNHVKLVVETVQKHQMTGRSTLQSFVLEALPIAKQLEPGIKTSALFTLNYFQGARMRLGLGSGIREDAITAALRVKADIISPYKMYVNEDFVREAHEKGLWVIPFTVNETEEMLSLLDIKVDGIISDYPDRLHSAYLAWVASEKRSQVK